MKWYFKVFSSLIGDWPLSQRKRTQLMRQCYLSPTSFCVLPSCGRFLKLSLLTFYVIKWHYSCFYSYLAVIIIMFYHLRFIFKQYGTVYEVTLALFQTLLSTQDLSFINDSNSIHKEVFSNVFVNCQLFMWKC